MTEQLCGHDFGCDCEAPITPPPEPSRKSPHLRLGERARYGVQGRLEVCPYCDGVRFHKKTCQRPHDQVPP